MSSRVSSSSICNRSPFVVTVRANANLNWRFSQQAAAKAYVDRDLDVISLVLRYADGVRKVAPVESLFKR